MSSVDVRCPPYVAPAPADVDASGNPLTILELAARASAASNRWCTMMDARGNFTDTLRAAGVLARATDALTTAISDAVATGDNRLS